MRLKSFLFVCSTTMSTKYILLTFFSFQKLSGQMKRKEKGRKKREKEVLGVFSGNSDMFYC